MDVVVGAVAVAVAVVVVAVDEVAVAAVDEVMVAADGGGDIVMARYNRHKLMEEKMKNPVRLSNQSTTKYQLQTEQQRQKKSKLQQNCRRCNEENI